MTALVGARDPASQDWPFFPGYVVFIYGLLETGSDRVHYVGSSTDPQLRLQGHWWDRFGGAGAKGDWMADLARRGERPVLRLFEITTEQRRREIEYRWIRFLKKQGHPLTNARPG